MLGILQYLHILAICARYPIKVAVHRCIRATAKNRRALCRAVGVPILYQYSSKRLLYTAIGGTCKNTIGGTQWENF